MLNENAIRQRELPSDDGKLLVRISAPRTGITLVTYYHGCTLTHSIAPQNVRSFLNCFRNRVQVKLTFVIFAENAVRPELIKTFV